MKYKHIAVVFIYHIISVICLSKKFILFLLLLNQTLERYSFISHIIAITLSTSQLESTQSGRPSVMVRRNEYNTSYRTKALSG